MFLLFFFLIDHLSFFLFIFTLLLLLFFVFLLLTFLLFLLLRFLLFDFFLLRLGLFRSNKFTGQLRKGNIINMSISNFLKYISEFLFRLRLNNNLSLISLSPINPSQLVKLIHFAFPFYLFIRLKATGGNSFCNFIQSQLEIHPHHKNHFIVFILIVNPILFILLIFFILKWLLFLSKQILNGLLLAITLG